MARIIDCPNITIAVDSVPRIIDCPNMILAGQCD